MPERRNLSLGGLSISLIPDRISGEYEYEKRMREFHTSYPPEVILNVNCGWFPEIKDGKVVFESNLSWRMLQDGDQKIIRIRSADQDPYQIGVFPANFHSGEVYVAVLPGSPDKYVFPLSFPLGELFMMNLLGSGFGVLFHACGVIFREEGYLFCGYGRAGKTTTAKLWEALPGARVVNDDKVIVRQQAGGYFLYGTPWHGEGGMVLPDSAPLKHIFILKQAPVNSISALHPSQATAGLLARAFIPIWDAEKMAFILSFLENLVSNIPCLEFGFMPDPSAVDFVLGLE